MASGSVPLRVLLHATSLGLAAYAFQSLHHVSDISGVNIEDQYAGHYQFLTICGLTGATITNALALVNDLVPGIPGLIGLKLGIQTCILPLESLITILYWSLLAMNPDFLMPPRQEPDPLNPGIMISTSVFLPLSIDLCLHFFPAVLLLVDFLLFTPPFSKKVHPGIVAAATTITYCLWIEHTASHNGFYPYPLLNMLSIPGRTGVYTTSSIIMAGSAILEQKLHLALDSALGRTWIRKDGNLVSSTSKKRA